MDILAYMTEHGHEQLNIVTDKESGLRAVIAVHDTTLGPSLGGCRFYPFESTEAAILDVLRLSEGMSYKSAMAGLPLGGGKCVVIGDPRSDKSAELFRALGRAVQQMGGRYITAEDVGTTVADLETVSETTDYVAGLSVARGGGGDPSPWTPWAYCAASKPAQNFAGAAVICVANTSRSKGSARWAMPWPRCCTTQGHG